MDLPVTTPFAQLKSISLSTNNGVLNSFQTVLEGYVLCVQERGLCQPWVQIQALPHRVWTTQPRGPRRDDDNDLSQQRGYKHHANQTLKTAIGAGTGHSHKLLWCYPCCVCTENALPGPGDIALPVATVGCPMSPGCMCSAWGFTTPHMPRRSALGPGTS